MRIWSLVEEEEQRHHYSRGRKGAGGASKKKGENREKSKMMPFELRVTDFPFDIELRLNKTRHQLPSTDSSIPLL